jgi:hypothetical protein
VIFFIKLFLGMAGIHAFTPLFKDKTMNKAMLVTTSFTALLGLSACSSSFDIKDGRSQILAADKRVLSSGLL